MKDGFKGFYNPNGDALKVIWNSSNTIFVFDTNVYLNIYSYAEKTKSDLFSVLDIIKDKLWVPNHVALEYQKRRLEIIDRERENFTKITNVFNKFNNQINVEIIQNLGMEKKLPDLHKSLSDFLVGFNSLCADFINGVFEEQKKLKPDVRSSDEIRKKLDSILSGKVGKPFTQSELDAIYEKGEVRFTNKIPPGFKDAGKGGDASDFTYMNLNYKRKFGDLIIWEQLIREASREDIENVVFITDDKKNDWWYGVGDKIIGPQERLQSEFYSLTNVDSFKMYDTVDFLKDAVEYLGTKVDEKSFDDVKKASASVVANSVSTDSLGISDNYTLASKNNVSHESDNNEESEIEDVAFLAEYLDIHESKKHREAMMRSIDLESLQEQKEAIMRGLDLKSQLEQEHREAMMRSIGLESLREQKEAIMSSLDLKNRLEQKRREAMMRSIGLESLREQKEAIMSSLDLKNRLEQKRREAMMRSIDLESLQEQKNGIRTLWELKLDRGHIDEIKTTDSEEVDTHFKKNDKYSNNKNNTDENDENSEDDAV